MLIILLNIIPVFNDDGFGLFLTFIYLNVTYLYDVDSFLAYQYYRMLLVDQVCRYGSFFWVPVIWTLLCS